MIKPAVRVLVVSLVSLVVTASSVDAAEQEESYVKEGPYVGLSLVQNFMSGDFDDTGFFFIRGSNGDPNTVIDMPRVDDGMGFGVVVGWRLPTRSVELGYQRTMHDTSSAFVEFGENDAALNVVDLNVKFDVFAHKKFRPYVLLGAGIPWLTIEDSQVEGTTYHDATYAGVCLNGGVGVAYYIKPQWAVTGGLLYRHNWFTSVEEMGLPGNLIEHTIGVTLGVAYTF